LEHHELSQLTPASEVYFKLKHTHHSKQFDNSDVSKDWTPKNKYKDKHQAFNDKDKKKDYTYMDKERTRT